mmetsp:Transcript_51/g.83  ORF Transcript_51/g.83 Transcript_51/m.83 type:complete len:113 (+) Transcript_51:86-424(+)
MSLNALYDGGDSSSDAQEQSSKSLMNQVTLRRPVIENDDSLPNLAFRNTGAEWILWIHRYSINAFVIMFCMVVMLFVPPFLERIFDVDDVSSEEADLDLLMATKRLNDVLSS